MSTATRLYHFTSSAQFPRIVRSGELRPIVFVGQPRDFVHATDNEHGERTAAAIGPNAAPMQRLEQGGIDLRPCRLRAQIGTRARDEGKHADGQNQT